MITGRPERVAALLLLALAGGCGGADEGPALLFLSALYAPPAALLDAAEGGRAYAQGFDVARESWEAEDATGLWRARAPWYGGPLPVLVDEEAQLVLEGDMALRWTAAALPADLDEAGAFAVQRREDGDYVMARLAPGTAPGPGRIEVRLSAGAPGGRGWRLAAGPLVGDGFLLRPDAPASFELDVAPGQRLLLGAVCLGGEASAVGLRVKLDGELAGERTLRASPAFAQAALSFDLPAEGRAGARLVLEVEGDAWCGVFEPRLAAVGAPPAQRPDVVLFLADTFRADNLAFYGGTDGATPVLDAFGETCVRFRRAWAPACWTLPSHASFFLGVYPPQHGAVAPGRTPGKELVSIAERLRAAGYRTAAVTDSLFVSRRFGLDRGFDHFEEYNQGIEEQASALERKTSGLERTLARARALAAEDDGRPLFLFVHTYRAHEPYEVTDATRAELGARLGLGPSWEELKQQVFDAGLARFQAGDKEALALAQGGDFQGLLDHLGFTGPESAGGEAFVDSLRALYRGGVRDLDRAFGTFLAQLDARPRADNTWLLFTSDHGEAFNEHQSLFHGYGSHEENLRVPLLLRGPSLAHRDVEHAVSLVDLPRTIVDIAGLAPDPRWLGSSLLGLDEERPVFAFDCAQRDKATGMLVRGTLKVVFEPTAEALRERRIVRAFDLAADPGERADLGAGERPRAALEALAEEATRLLVPLASPGQAALSATELQSMKAVGYMGSE
jgi:arylsulfatase A-like enzyme